MDWKKIKDISQKGKKAAIAVIIAGLMALFTFTATEEIAEYELGKLDQMKLK